MNKVALLVCGDIGDELEKKLEGLYSCEKMTIEDAIRYMEAKSPVPTFFVLNLCCENEFYESNLREEIIHLLDLAVHEMIVNPFSSIVVLLPEENSVNDKVRGATTSYFLQGMIKSVACEVGRDNMILNCVVAHAPYNKRAMIDTTAFLSDERAYTTGQVFHLSSMMNSISAEDLGKRVALITGSGQGIGLATANAFSDSTNIEIDLIINDLHETKGMQDLAKRGKATCLIGDISDSDKFPKLLENRISEKKRVDIFVGNAAFMKLEPFTFENEALIKKHYDINVEGHIKCLEQIIPIMKKQRSGVIILMSSMFGILGWKNGSGYASSKAAMIGLVKELHRQLSAFNIAVVGVAPGVIDTPQLKADADDLNISIEEMKNIYAEDTMLGRIGTPESVGHLISFLANGGAYAMSGHIIQTNGGECRATCES